MKCAQAFSVEEVKDEVVTCPHCAHVGKPAGVMRPNFPSLETFAKSVKRSLEQNEE